MSAAVGSELSYVYCVAHQRGRPKLERAPAGVPGTTDLRAVAVGPDLWMIVARARGPEHEAAAIERGLRDFEWVSVRAAAHEAVVEHVSRHATVLPMKLFTLFRSEERALAHVKAMRPRIQRTIERVRDRQEWGVRVRLAGSPRRPVPDRERRPAAAVAASGTRFLLDKRAERAAGRQALREGLEAAEALYGTLERLADAGTRRPPTAAGGARLLLDAAFLVPRDRVARFKMAARRGAITLAEHGCELEMTGPWPPYNFLGARP